jgi:uncharacterized phage-associated protein
MNPRVLFDFDERKATSAAAVFLRRAGRTMNYMKLLKLLYIAERESLRRFGRPICGDDYVSMKLGPVMSIVFNLIKEERSDEDFWLSHIRRRENEKYEVELFEDPGLGPLSEAEIELLETTFDHYKNADQWDLSRISHEFPEWDAPKGSCHKIPPERVLRAVGKSDEEIDEIAREARERQYFDGLFGPGRPCG